MIHWKKRRFQRVENSIKRKVLQVETKAKVPRAISQAQVSGTRVAQGNGIHQAFSSHLWSEGLQQSWWPSVPVLLNGQKQELLGYCMDHLTSRHKNGSEYLHHNCTYFISTSYNGDPDCLPQI